MEIPDNVNNPILETPPRTEGTTPNVADAEVDFSSLSDDDLERLVKEGPPEPEESEESNAPNQNVEEPEQKAEKEEEETEYSDESLRSKSPEELAKMYTNLRSLHDKHAKEIGELRQFKKTKEAEEAQAINVEIDTIADKLVEQIGEMTPDERDSFLTELANTPRTVLNREVKKAMQPVLVKLARLEYKQVIKDLKETTKDALVPYNEVEVEKIISRYNKDGVNQLISQYGSKAFEVAYKEYVLRNVDAAVAKKLSERSKKSSDEAEEARVAEKDAYTESTGAIQRRRSGPPDFKTMSDAELARFVGAPPDD